MDHRLAEFVARLRSTLKIRGRSLRIVQRRLAARYLPKEILMRPKQGFASALPYILRKEYGQLYEHFLVDSTLVDAGIVRADAIQKLLTTHLAGRADHGQRLWLLINAEIWHRMMIRGTTRESLRAEIAGTEVGPSAPTPPQLETSPGDRRTTDSPEASQE